jgi:hypothetical protein
MLSMVNTENIVAFVKNTLGCNCPDEVFSLIECQTGILCSGIVLDMKINVGNRLLIYIGKVNDPDTLRRMLPVLVTAGKKERDGAGFNRFRLVLAADDINAIEKEAKKIFNTLNEDEKIYLHTLPGKSIPKCSTG